MMRRPTVWSMMHRVRKALTDDGKLEHRGLVLDIAPDAPFDGPGVPEWLLKVSDGGA